MIKTIRIVCYLISVVSINCLQAATTAFNYQGQVMYEGAPANGSFDIKFRLYDNPDNMAINSELSEITQTLVIEDGLLNTELDFGDIFFDGQDLWIHLFIQDPTGTPGFFSLMPRVAINSAPYAIQAQFTDISTSLWSSNPNGIDYTAGRVGIGLTNPAAILNIHGDSSDELRLSGTNSTPSLHFRRNSNGADWYLKIDPSTNQFFFQSEANSVEKIMTIKPDGEITRKKQTRTAYVSYKSFIPESHVFTYSTLNFLGLTGLHSTYSGGGPAKFHADVDLPADAVITKFEVMAGDNSGSGSVVAKLGFRVFGTSNGVINLSTLTSSNSPYAEVIIDALNAAVGNDRSYFIDVEIDNVTTPGQDVIFAGVRITYETTVL